MRSCDASFSDAADQGAHMQSSTSASPRVHAAGDGSSDLAAELARILDDRAVNG